MHVDDVMFARDGLRLTDREVEGSHKKYPYREWHYVRDEFDIGQADFIDGRMDQVRFNREEGCAPESACTPAEHAESSSGVGDLHWVTSQTRVDHAVDTRLCQKRRNAAKH